MKQLTVRLNKVVEQLTAKLNSLRKDCWYRIAETADLLRAVPYSDDIMDLKLWIWENHKDLRPAAQRPSGLKVFKTQQDIRLEVVDKWEQTTRENPYFVTA